MTLASVFSTGQSSKISKCAKSRNCAKLNLAANFSDLNFEQYTVIFRCFSKRCIG